jgi:Concanavalin A-like lectin/glucanases superfamily
LTAWVRLPSLSSTQDTVLYMYYGNASSVAQQIPEKVWNSDFQAVWHLNTNPSDLVKDSTAKDHDGVAEGDMTSSDLLLGKIGRCLNFDGIDDLISFSEFTDSLNTGTCTAWVQTTSPTIGTVWGEANSNNNKPYILLGKYTDDFLTYARDIYGLDSNYQGRISTGMNDGQWHHVAWISKGSGSGNTFYFDGQPVSLSWQDGQNPNGIWFDDQTTDTHSIGALDRPLLDCQWAGSLDEIRLLDTPLSTAWVATEYVNQNAPSSFMVFSLEESHP